MIKYVLLIEGNGEYAHINHTNDEWCGTSQPADMMTVVASNHVSALNKFVKMLGIEVRYRNGFSVTDRNLHGFGVESLDDVTKRFPNDPEPELEDEPGFTPGPWHLNGLETVRSTIHAQRGHVATVSAGTMNEVSPNEIEANARLIARAPELLAENAKLRAALETIAGWKEFRGGSFPLELGQIAQAALNNKRQ